MHDDLDPRQSMTQGIYALRAYIAEHDHSRISMSFVQGYFALGRWVEDIRAAKARLSAEQIERLDEIPGWSWDSTARRTRRDHADNFEIGLMELQDVVARTGSTAITDYNSELGRWVKSRRLEYKRGGLSADRIGLLESMPNWVWDAQDAKYEKAIEHYLAFVGSHGHGRVPAFYRDPQDGYSLGQWVVHQRELNAGDVLRQDRKVRLSRLPHWAW